MSKKVDCSSCSRDKCPDDCVVNSVFSDTHAEKYVAYINETSVYKIRNDMLYMNNVGSIDVLPYYLVLGQDRYQIVKFGTELRPAVTKTDIRKYIQACVTKDFWMANHF